MGMIIPSYATGFARSQGESKYPQDWEGLVGAWCPFLGPTGGLQGATLRDMSGHGNHGEAKGNPQWVIGGKFGSALDFDGTGDYVSTTLDVGTTMYVSSWINIDTMPSNKVIFSWNGSAANEGLIHYSGRWNLYSVSGAFDIYPASPTPVLGKWHHVVFGFKAGVAAYLYVDNVLIGSAPTITTPTTSVFFIGGGSLLFDGQIDNILIYNRALTAAEIALRYCRPLRMFERRDVIYAPVGVPTAKPMWYYEIMRKTG